MTQNFDPKALQFYVTIAAPCPYLPDQLERKIFTQLDPLGGPFLNDYLTHSGFRRSQNVIYRPACESCNACKSLRVRAADFTLTKSMKKARARNKDLTREICEPYATREQFELLSRYLTERHPQGGMADMDFSRFEYMVEDCAARTMILEYRNPEGLLMACCLVDELADGLSMVYSFYMPELSRRSLGNYMIIDHLELCATHKLPYLYLGYWVKDSQKMDYKIQYRPAEILTQNGWRDVDDIQL